MGLRMEAADEIRSSERELMTGSGACRAKVHACRALAFRTRMTFMRRRGPGELPYNSRQSAPSCLAGRLMSDLGQRLSPAFQPALPYRRSEEHTSELQSLMRISYAVFCLKKKTKVQQRTNLECIHY